MRSHIPPMPLYIELQFENKNRVFRACVVRSFYTKSAATNKYL